MTQLGITWPYTNDNYTKRRDAWKFLEIFSRTYLITKERKRTENRINIGPQL